MYFFYFCYHLWWIKMSKILWKLIQNFWIILLTCRQTNQATNKQTEAHIWPSWWRLSTQRLAGLTAERRMQSATAWTLSAFCARSRSNNVWWMVKLSPTNVSGAVAATETGAWRLLGHPIRKLSDGAFKRDIGRPCSPVCDPRSSTASAIARLGAGDCLAGSGTTWPRAAPVTICPARRGVHKPMQKMFQSDTRAAGAYSGHRPKRETILPTYIPRGRELQGHR